LSWTGFDWHVCMGYCPLESQELRGDLGDDGESSCGMFGLKTEI
jgi:hypothetical protein